MIRIRYYFYWNALKQIFTSQCFGSFRKEHLTRIGTYILETYLPVWIRNGGSHVKHSASHTYMQICVIVVESQDLIIHFHENCSATIFEYVQIR